MDFMKNKSKKIYIIQRDADQLWNLPKQNFNK